MSKKLRVTGNEYSKFSVGNEVLWGDCIGTIREVTTDDSSYSSYLVSFPDHIDMCLCDDALTFVPAKKETVKLNGKWNGHYIAASKEAYDLLVADGYLCNVFAGYKYIKIYDNMFKFTEIVSGCKPIYIVDGKLSATKEVKNTEIEELKEKYATGKYVAYYLEADRGFNYWFKSDQDGLHSRVSTIIDVLILKEHSHIADAVIANPDVKIEYKTLIGWFNLVTNFFETYSEELIYKLKEQPEQVSDREVATPQYKPDEVAFVSSKHLKCDTVEWSKQNHTLEQQKGICQFMINKYSMREKGQDAEDIVKIKFYIEWLEQIVKS